MADPSAKWAALAEEIKKNLRGHADYFSWETNREVKEYGVVVTLQESLEKTGKSLFAHPISRGVENDPPDCEGDDLKGGVVGIEVTELVEADSIIAVKNGRSPEWRPWAREEFHSLLQRRLAAKDNPRGLKGGPYSSYILVIYSDEPRALSHELLSDLGSVPFGARKLIDRCFFLMSYDPKLEYCRYVELSLVDAQPALPGDGLASLGRA